MSCKNKGKSRGGQLATLNLYFKLKELGKKRLEIIASCISTNSNERPIIFCFLIMLHSSLKFYHMSAYVRTCERAILSPSVALAAVNEKHKS